MISFLRGQLFQLLQDAVIIEVGGLGYEVQVHNRMISQLPPVGGQLLLHSYLQVMENEFKLFGFLSRHELELFKLLLSVSGIGSRAALNILGSLEPDTFFQAIASGDEKLLVTIPGIGKKTAQRLIFELKDKLGQGPGAFTPPAAEQTGFTEVLEALEVLGYNRSEIFPVLLEMQSQGQLSERVEDNIKKVLKKQALLMKK